MAKCPKADTSKKSYNRQLTSDVVGEQKLGSGRVQGLLFGFMSGSWINISGASPSAFWGF